MKKTIIISAICLLAATVAKAQQANTMYFLENIPERQLFNPAFQPASGFYLTLPLGYTDWGFTAPFAFDKLIYPEKDVNGNYLTAFSSQANKQKLYNSLMEANTLGLEGRVNLLSFGFRTGRSYWTFNTALRIDGAVNLPKDLFGLVLFGTPADPDRNQFHNTFDLKSLSGGVNVYAEAALGYSREINDKWNIGVKVRYIHGLATATTSNKYLTLDTDIDRWQAKGEGSVNAAGFWKIADNVEINKDTKFEEVVDIPKLSLDMLTKPAGMGAGFDLGVTFKPVDALTLSAAVTDLGMIFWNKNPQNITYNINYWSEALLNANALLNSESRDTLLNSLEGSATLKTGESKTFTTYTTPKLNIGAEYGFWNYKMSVGLLSRTYFYQTKTPREELTASFNLKPVDWFNVGVSYSYAFDKNLPAAIGVGVGLRTGIFLWHISADMLSFNRISVPLLDIPSDFPVMAGKKLNYPAGYRTNTANVALGVSWVFNNRQDKDRDGVKNWRDLCPDTPRKVEVDKNGCPLDSDGDGVPDYLDKCPDTPVEARGFIDESGCPLDSDGDGVPDYLDKCPDTPPAAIGFTDENGCPKDTDGDGVPDYLDRCPNTLAAAIGFTDEFGCPLDSDGDGVPDYLDKCPDTPAAAKGFVDENGCLLDTDGDGVPDYLDKCPDTQAGAPVDENGCPSDEDGDGVPDYLDKCPKTPAAARGFVDEFGCPKDTDGDGIPDYLDDCPKLAGVKSNGGCPELKKEIRQLFQKALHGIQFDVAKSTIKPVSHAILNDIVKVMQENPSYKINIKGHTDSDGKPEANLTLSKNRASAVATYLINNGISADRLTSEGYGDTLPVASNKTKAGKAQNRRVEFVVEFEEVTYE